MEDGNIDVRMSNYLAILSNQGLRGKINSSVAQDMETALAIYAATTSRKFIDDFNRQKSVMESEKNVSSML